MSAIALDPLIAEAKERARRRRLLLAVGAIVLVAVVAVAASFAVESGGAATGLCAAAPPGWKEKSLPKTATTEATVVLTNWRFGQMNNFYGLATAQQWPRTGVMVAVLNEGPDVTPRFRPALRVSAAEFLGFEGMRSPGAQTAIRAGGRVIDAYVEVGTVTPGTIAAANAALAGVHTCST